MDEDNYSLLPNNGDTETSIINISLEKVSLSGNKDENAVDQMSIDSKDLTVITDGVEDFSISNGNVSLHEPHKHNINSLEETNEINKVNSINSTEIYGNNRLISSYSVSDNPIVLSAVCKEFSNSKINGFLKGCAWSPDGTCVLTNCDEQVYKIFDLPAELYSSKTLDKNQVLPLSEPKKSLEIKDSNLVYSYCWFPLMNSWDPITCCFVSSVRSDPVRLWDAYNGCLRGTYISRDYADFVISPFIVNFSRSGDKLFCGLKNRIDIFNVAVPGNNYTTLSTNGLTSSKGMISAIAVNPELPDVLAAGTFQRSIGLFSLSDGNEICQFRGHVGGLTHLMFSNDGCRLYSGSRKDSEIVCWDLRNPGKVLFSLYRTVTTNQRILFDMSPDEKYLISGNTDGKVSIWDLRSSELNNEDEAPVMPNYQFQAYVDCCNGISINKRYPVLATSSGQRHFPDLNTDDSTDKYIFNFDSLIDKTENCLTFWWIGPVN